MAAHGRLACPTLVPMPSWIYRHPMRSASVGKTLPSQQTLCKYTNNIDQYNDNQYAALLAFAFNIGGGAPAGSPRGPSGYAGSGMLAALNRGDLNGCFAGWAQWNKFRNPETHLLEVSAGLVKRRNLEMALYNKPL